MVFLVDFLVDFFIELGSWPLARRYLARGQKEAVQRADGRHSAVLYKICGRIIPCAEGSGRDSRTKSPLSGAGVKERPGSP